MIRASGIYSHGLSCSVDMEFMRRGNKESEDIEEEMGDLPDDQEKSLHDKMIHSSFINFKRRF